MIIVLRCSILAVIKCGDQCPMQLDMKRELCPVVGQLPAYPLSDCLLADICNHTWVPECAEDVNIDHRRLFIDECDIYEYNCDYDNKYLIVNYSDCFGPMTCPTLPPQKMLRQGNYLYRADGRIVYSPTTKTTPTAKSPHGKRRYTPEKGRKKKTTSTTPCSPCMRGMLDHNQPQWKPKPKPRPKLKPKPKPKPKPNRRQLKPPRTTRRTTRKLTTVRTTKQVIKTATIGTVILRKITVIKNGKTVFKVIKGYAPTTTATTKADSDFLE